MGAAYLDDMVPGGRLRGEAAVEALQSGKQPHVDGARRGDVHRRREAVVRRLAQIDMVVGMDGALAAALPGQDLVGTPGDHFVGVHVRLGAGAGLPDDERELVVMRARRDLARGRLHRLAEPGVEVAGARIDSRRGLLDETQGVNDLARHRFLRAEREILDRPLGLRAPIAIAGNVDVAEAVALGAVGVERRHWETPFALSLSKGLSREGAGFDKLSPNGCRRPISYA